MKQIIFFHSYYLRVLIFQESKIETEKKYSLEIVKVNNLNKRIEELEELVNKLKEEFDENSLTLKTTIISLENSLSETTQKYDLFLLKL